MKQNDNDSSLHRTRKIWMLNHYAATAAQAGGSRHLDLSRALENKGWSAEIFACSFDHVTRKYSKPTSWKHPVLSETVGEVQFRWIHSTPYFDNGSRRYLNMLVFSCILLLYGVIRKSKPDVVLGSSAHLLTPLAGRILAWRCRAIFVVEVRDLWPDSLIQLGLDNKSIIKVLRVIEKFVYRQADLLIGVSQGIVDGIIRNGGMAKKTILLSHGIESEPNRSLVLAQREMIREELGWQSSFVVLWAGSMEPFNGLDVAVKAATRLIDNRNVKLVLLGSGSERLALEKQAAGLPNVIVAESVPRGESFRWMVAADAGLLISRKFNAFTGTRPRKIFDYMSASLPILCFVPGEASQVVSDANAGVTCSWATPENVADTIKWCIEHQHDLGQLGNNGLRAVETTYSLTMSAEILDDQLKRILQERAH